jgi:hypothetical protein
MIEVAITLTLVSGMALILERTLSTTRRTERYLEAVRKATERGQSLAYDLRLLVSSSRRLLHNDDIGRAYLAALDLQRDPPLVGARLPVADDLGRLELDPTGDPRTGNMLLFVQESDAVAATAVASTAQVRMIDTYRFICVYPRPTSRYVVQGRGRQVANDLVVWRSRVFPNCTQLRDIEDAGQRQSVVADLCGRFGMDMAWEPNKDVDESFFRIDGFGNIAAAPLTDPDIEEDLQASDRGRLVYRNLQLAPSRSDAYRRSVFTTDEPETWAPGGFEVKVVGPSGARQVWMRLVVETEAGREEVAVLPSTVIASVRDL